MEYIKGNRTVMSTVFMVQVFYQLKTMDQKSHFCHVNMASIPVYGLLFSWNSVFLLFCSSVIMFSHSPLAESLPVSLIEECQSHSFTCFTGCRAVLSEYVSSQ